MNRPFAVFVVAHAWDDDAVFVAATTRDGGDTGRIGLPGGKVDEGESPVDAAVREAAEEGWDIEIPADAMPVHEALVDGRLVWWFAASAKPAKRLSWKEQSRGIIPVWTFLDTVAESGFGNDFLFDSDLDIGQKFKEAGLASCFDHIEGGVL
jgi:8-oxo-dGTP pyrophosphatase MutT (NUDIX family)